MRIATGVVIGALAAVWCGGCGKRGHEVRPDPAPDMALNTLVGLEGEEPAVKAGGSPVDAGAQGAATLDELVAQQALDLERLLSGSTSEVVAPAGGVDQGESAAHVSPSEVAAVDLEEGAAAVDGGVVDDQAVGAEVSTPDRLDGLYAELDAELASRLEGSSEPFRTAVALVALAAAQGRDPQSVLAAGSVVVGKLSPEEAASASAIAELLAGVLDPGSAGASDRAAVLERIALRLGQGLGLTIPRALLCTRVGGFGSYDEFSRTTFLAGRATRALVYVELDRFEHRAIDTSRFGPGVRSQDQWSVEVSQELQILHEADGRLAWRRPAEKVVETSRNQRRDFYLVTEIELPRTLTVGSYMLKVVVRDEVSGGVAEALIPVGIVADPALAWEPG